MLEYPSVSSEIQYGGPYFIYDKLDGQNVRAEWSKKRGWYKLGARHTHLEDRWRPEVATALEDKGMGLIPIFARLRWDRAVCFFEFLGDNSFAGVHVEEPHRLALFDVGLRDSLLDPRDFYKSFYGNVPTPQLLERGNFNHDLERSVRESTLLGMTFEGVVVKGAPRRSGGLPVMFKCKSQAWIDKLNSLYGERAKDLL